MYYFSHCKLDFQTESTRAIFSISDESNGFYYITGEGGHADMATISSIQRLFKLLENKNIITNTKTTVITPDDTEQYFYEGASLTTDTDTDDSDAHNNLIGIAIEKEQITFIFEPYDNQAEIEIVFAHLLKTLNISLSIKRCKPLSLEALCKLSILNNHTHFTEDNISQLPDSAFSAFKNNFESLTRTTP